MLSALYGYCVCVALKLYKSFEPEPKVLRTPDGLVEVPQFVEVPLPISNPSPDMVFSKLREKYDPSIKKTENGRGLEDSI